METTTALIFTAYMVPVNLIDNILRPILMTRGLRTPMLVIFIGAVGGTLSNGITVFLLADRAGRCLGFAGHLGSVRRCCFNLADGGLLRASTSLWMSLSLGVVIRVLRSISNMTAVDQPNISMPFIAAIGPSKCQRSPASRRRAKRCVVYKGEIDEISAFRRRTDDW